MKKTIIQGLILVVLFFSTWFALKQIDWLKVFQVQKFSDKTEKKLGDLIWESINKSEKENKNPFVVNTIDSIVNKICNANKIDKKSIKVHIINKDEINAFAIPNGHLVVYSGLILNSDNPEELTGVICHEIAHIELNHVMKKLVKELGLSVIISMASGNGGEMIKQTSKTLSSSAFDRSMEKEADIKAVDYMLNAEINPEPLANFLYKISAKENDATKYLSWLSTHPDSKARAEYIIEYSKDKKENYKAVITESTWVKLKEELRSTEE